MVTLASYFSRTSVAAAQVLQGFDDAEFRRKLARCSIALALDASAARSMEGRVAFDLTVDLLARLYPTLAFAVLDDAAETAEVVARARAHARRVNARIDRDGKVHKSSVLLVFGRTPTAFGGTVLHVGSDNWTARLDVDAPVGSGDTANPFGAAAAACLAAANVFRSVFADQVDDARLDSRLAFDTLRSSCDPAVTTIPLPDELHLGELHFAGLGAIGRAAAWTMARLPKLSGTLILVDGEKIDLSNLQRYVWSTESDVGRVKVERAAVLFGNAGLSVKRHRLRWGEYLALRGDTLIDRVAVALDTAEDRMAVQAALPRRLLNAWTQVGDLGVSRHGFDDGPCAMCLYMPSGEAPSESTLVAQAIKLPETEVRAMLHAGARVDRRLAHRIAEAAGVDFEDIRRFIGEPLRTFYAKAVCGTTVFGAPDRGERGAYAVPMAFQSAMAGVLLAAEVVADVASLDRGAVSATTRLDLMRPLGRDLHVPVAKSGTGRCICQDADYLDRYRDKYAIAFAT